MRDQIRASPRLARSPSDGTVSLNTAVLRLIAAGTSAEARWVLRRVEFHFVPKHASRLNMVEIEIGVLRSQCLDRRIATNLPPADLAGVVLPVKLPHKSAKPNENRIHHTFMY